MYTLFPMNSIAVIHAGKTYYYAKLGKDDYYTGGLDPRGTVSGEGAKELGIDSAKIEHKDKRLLHLFCGNTPDGKTVMRQGGGVVREYEDKQTGEIKKYKPVCAYDNTFSAPKDVSIFYALGDDKMREKIFKIHEKAVKEATSYLETQIYTRTKESTDPDRIAEIKAGVDTQVKENWQKVNKKEITKEQAIALNKEVREKGKEERSKVPVTFKHHECKGIFASFTHTTSRELDPQLHTHLLVLNAAIRKDGQGYGAVDSKRILESRYVSGQIYQNYLRAELERQLGVKTFDRPFSDEKGVSFGIHGVTQSVSEHFSKRSLQVRERLTPQMTGAQVRAEFLKDRKTKQHNINSKEISDEWRRRGVALGFNVNRVVYENQKSLKKQAIDRIKEKVAGKFVSEEKRREKEEQRLFRKVASGLNRRSLYMAVEKDRGKEKEQEKKPPVSIPKTAKVISAVKKTEGEREGKKEKEEVDLTLFKRQTVVSSILKHDRNLHWKEAEKLADRFLERYSSKNEIERQKKSVSQGHEILAEKDRKVTVHKLNEQGLNLAVERSKREQLLDTTQKILSWRREAINRLEDWKQQQKHKSFDRRMKFFYWTGKISRKQYLQIKNNTQVEYSGFKLAVFEAVGIISHKQAKYIRSQKELQGNPYYQINAMRREGRISYSEAKELRLNQWKEDKREEEAVRMTGEKAKITDRGRERERIR